MICPDLIALPLSVIGKRKEEQMHYIFFDYNDDTNEDCDIQGEDYRELLRVCFRYSEVFSVWISPFMALSDQLKPYEITVEPLPEKPS